VDIEAKGLTKNFGQFKALRGVGFRLPSGSRTGLLGPNGAGKTTLLRVLMGMLKAGGEISLGGLPASTARQRLADQMAYVPQIAPRLPAPVGEIALAVAKLRRGSVEAVLKSARDMDLDLDSAWTKPFAGLSGGSRQRFLISLALAFPVQLYILDEPTAALDPEGRQRFFSLFRRVAAGATVLLSSHRVEELRHLVDRALVLKDGRLVFEGPLEGLSTGRAGSMIEVRAEATEGSARLAALGFSRTVGDWWCKAVDLDEKRKLLPELARHMDGDWADIQVRDMERLDLDGTKGQSHENC